MFYRHLPVLLMQKVKYEEVMLYKIYNANFVYLFLLDVI